MTDLLPVTDLRRERPRRRHGTRAPDRTATGEPGWCSTPRCSSPTRRASSSFDGVDIVVPLTVVEELDGLKTRPDDVGRAARTALRTIEDLRVRHGGSLAEPVPVGNGATLRIEINGVQKHLLIEHGLDPASPDNRIIGAALGQAERGPTTMVSNDAALRIKAAHLGVAAAEHRPARRTTPRSPSAGRRSRPPSRSSTASTPPARSTSTRSTAAAAVGENEFAVLRAGSQSALTRRVGDDLRAAVAHRARGVGAAGPLEGAALRPRAAARPGDRGRRPRRPRRHRQDAARRRRRARAGRRAEPLRAPRDLPPAGAGRPGRRRLPARRSRREARPVDVGDPRRRRRPHRPARRAPTPGASSTS